MPVSMYRASIPVLKSMLGNLDHWLDLADAHAQAKKHHGVELGKPDFLGGIVMRN